MADGTDSLCGDIRVERNAEPWQVQVAVDAAELLAGLDHPGGAPAQRHGAVLPVLHVARVGAGDGDHRLDAVGRAQRAGPVSYTHLRAHETRHDLVCRLL